MGRGRQKRARGHAPSMAQGAIEVVRGDITLQDVDAVVNAANESLLGGGGVDGAIHRAAGPELLAECLRLHGCLPGEAKATAGYGLAARHVIHTVGPRYRGGGQGEAETLARCHLSAVRLAHELGLGSLAFPAISTGIFGYPPEQAAPVALGATAQALERWPLRQVRFVLFDERMARVYERALRAL